MREFGAFLANLRSGNGLSLEELAKLVNTSKSTLSRLENDDIPLPFKGAMRRLVITLAQLLCSSQQETERYLSIAGIEKSFLTQTEEIALGFIPQVISNLPGELINLQRYHHICEQCYQQLDKWEQHLRDYQEKKTKRQECLAHHVVRRKKQEYAKLVRDFQQQINILKHHGQNILDVLSQTSSSDKTLHETIARYLEQQRVSMLNALAPGSTNLRVRDIVGKDGLFITPSWKNLGHGSSSKDLIEHLIESLIEGQRILLLGEAGQGKTTILKQVFSILVDRFINDTSSSMLIPLYVPLRAMELASKNYLESLWSYLQEGFPLSFEEFTGLISNNQIVFLFDGFDEIQGELSQRSINERTTSKLFRLPSILTCRKNFYEFYLSMSVLHEYYS